MDQKQRQRRSQRTALRIGVVPLLFALVGIPLLVVGGLIVQDLRQADVERSTVQEIVPVAHRRIGAIRLRAALSDERTWAIAALGVRQYGVEPEVVREAIGVDIEQRFALSMATTDGLAEGWPHVQEALAGVRNSSDGTLDLAAGYQTLMLEVEAAGRDSAQQLQELSITLPVGEGLLRALSVTEAAANAQLAVNGQFVSSIAARFVQSTGDPENELQALIQHRRAYLLANEELDRSISPGPLEDQLEIIRNATAEKNLLNGVDSQIATALLTGLAPQEGEVFEAALGDLGSLEGFLVAAEASNASWVELTRAAGDELIVLAVDREHDSSAKIGSSRLLLTATGLVTLLATVLVALLFSRSVRRLAKAAQALRDGNTEPFAASGPREVFLAGTALSEATSNFHLLRRQATVLAEGHLTHSDLTQTAPGQLGATMKRVIDTLSASIHEREQAQENVVWQASHDGLTGLLNRSAAMDRISEHLDEEAGADIAVLVVDLDGFKEINDSHGHPAGDEVLVEIAGRLLLHCRIDDVVCRIGGDEFVMILAGHTTEADACDIAERLLASLGETIQLSTSALVRVSACVGIALSQADATVSSLLKNADVAVYEAKRIGRNQVVMCTTSLLAESHRTAQLTSDILDAIADSELRLEYQPIVDVTGRINAVEALIRWEHPIHGLIMPDSFIPIAERSDLIIAIDRWVIRTAVAQLAAWSELDDEMRDLVLAVNVSTRHLNAESAVQDILGPIEDHGIEPSRLCVEITETALMHDTEEVRATLEALREGGVRIALDDFGTGHSSITQLRLLPIDVIKIDRSFTSHVTNPGSFDAALIQLIIDTAHLLDAQIVTEGVESVEQAEAAIRMGTDALQGWLFSPSVVPKEVPALIAQQRFATSRLARKN